MSSTQADRARRFRALHDASGTFVLPNPWDVGTTRILAGLGFQAVATTSAGLAISLGRVDGLGLVTRDEALDHVRTIVAATDLPVSADLENGFGAEPAVVAETIRRAAAAGAVGGSIEDSGGDEAHPIYEATHALERIQAAVAAARALPFPFVLVARAENFLHGRADLDGTIARLRAFADAGADVLYAPGLPDLDAVRTVCAAVAPKPVNVLATGRIPAFTVANLAAAGVRRISLGSALARAAYGAFVTASRELAEHGTFGFGAKALPFAAIDEWMEGG